MTNEEIWKPIDGYENYEISNKGRVRSNPNKTRSSVRILKQGNVNGYKNVSLCKDGKLKSFVVHRLVAIAFLDNPYNYPCINHKSEEKDNNDVTNLEWCTYDYNNNFGNRNKKISKSNIDNGVYQRIADKYSKKVAQIDLEGNIVRIWDSAYQAQREGGYIQSNIMNCCNNKPHRKTHKGYKWQYI